MLTPGILTRGGCGNGGCGNHRWGGTSTWACRGGESDLLWEKEHEEHDKFEIYYCSLLLGNKQTITSISRIY